MRRVTFELLCCVSVRYGTMRCDIQQDSPDMKDGERRINAYKFIEPRIKYFIIHTSFYSHQQMAATVFFYSSSLPSSRRFALSCFIKLLFATMLFVLNECKKEFLFLCDQSKRILAVWFIWFASVCPVFFPVWSKWNWYWPEWPFDVTVLNRNDSNDLGWSVVFELRLFFHMLLCQPMSEFNVCIQIWKFSLNTNSFLVWQITLRSCYSTNKMLHWNT